MDGPESGTNAVKGSIEFDLAHHGIKGMKWGKRKASSASGSTTSKGKTTPRTSADATAMLKSQMKVHAGGTKTLSTKDLKDLVTRMNLEQQYSKLHDSPDSLKAGQDAAKRILGIGKTFNEIHSFLNSPVGKGLKLAFKGAVFATKVAHPGPATAQFALRQLTR